MSMNEPYRSETNYILRLFVAGDERNSYLAKINLKHICDNYLNGRHQLEVIDVLENVEAAVRNHVLVTPMLVLVAPRPEVTIIGNLSNTQRVLDALRLNG
ncbi:MAG: circadian clock protein KaiB [Anaerolineae bacterium]|nr:circadian clock protein KaiB [Anaerolineae bacterium]MCB0222233.1 circadian clock protein KaiB [Anaerolineae bacterium]MCB9108906.1 circadian clock protein KaiB [Anaerolineales bacterium]